ncbi:MAG: WG repeat-containing protein [Cyclobacteriaceae bacterium]
MKQKRSKKLNNLINFHSLILKAGVTLLLSFIFLQAFAIDEEWQVIKSGQFEGLANESGEVVIPPVYDAIGWSDGSTQVSGQVVGYKEGEDWGLISIRNKKLTRAQFNVLIPFENEKIKGAIKGKFSNHLFYGILDSKGTTQVDFDHFSIERFADGILLVSEYLNRKVHYGLITYEGQRVLPKKYEEINALNELIVAEKEGKKKIFKRTGESVFDFWIDKYDVQGNDVLIQKSGKYGLISEGNVKFDVKYKNIADGVSHSFNNWEILNINTETRSEIACDSLKLDGDAIWTVYANQSINLFRSSEDKILENSAESLIDIRNDHLLTQNQKTLKWSVYDRGGRAIVQQKDKVLLDSSYYFVEQKGRWDVFNYYGRKVNSKTFAGVLGAQGKAVAVNNHGYWGWMDFDGKMSINFKYDDLEFGSTKSHFRGKYIDKWGVFDFFDNSIIPAEYDKIEIIGGHYVAWKGYSRQIMSNTGETLIQTSGSVVGDQLLMFKESNWGAVLPSGELIDPVYDTIRAASGFYEFRQGEFVQLFTKNGKLIADFTDQIQDVLSHSEDHFLIKKGGNFGFVDSEGKLRIANRYDAAMPFSDGMAAIQLIGKWGFIDENETLRVQPFYDEVGFFQDGCAVVRVGNHFGIIDKDGNEVLSLDWKEVIRQPTGNFVVSDFEGRYGLVNAKGEIILSPVFESLEDTSLGLVVAGKYGRFGILDYHGYSKYPFEFDEIQIKGENILFLKDKLY